MAFCNNCGTQVNEGAKFCAKCGNAVAQTPPVQPKQASANTSIPQGVVQNATGGHVSPETPYNNVYTQTTTTDAGVKKLIRAAAIFGCAVFFILFGIEIVNGTLRSGISEFIQSVSFITFLPFLVLVISVILSFIGEKKKKRGLVLAAGIVYIWSILGIPSGILCILAFRKMPKQAK